MPLESDERVLRQIQAHGGSAGRCEFAVLSGLGAASESGARRRFDSMRRVVQRAAAAGGGSSAVGSGALAGALFDPARPPTRETRLYAPTPGGMGGLHHAQKPRSSQQC